jgi:hypothetical protein
LFCALIDSPAHVYPSCFIWLLVGEQFQPWKQIFTQLFAEVSKDASVTVREWVLSALKSAPEEDEYVYASHHSRSHGVVRSFVTFLVSCDFLLNNACRLESKAWLLNMFLPLTDQFEEPSDAHSPTLSTVALYRQNEDRMLAMSYVIAHFASSRHVLIILHLTVISASYILDVIFSILCLDVADHCLVPTDWHGCNSECGHGFLGLCAAHCKNLQGYTCPSGIAPMFSLLLFGWRYFASYIFFSSRLSRGSHDKYQGLCF